jgi:RNA polymerase sigma-70 factor (ECF subfamily)
MLVRRVIFIEMPSPIDLERLYDDHAQALFSLVLNLTRNETHTRDVLQEVFVKLARRPELLNGVRDERAFLLRLAHNLAIDQIRRRDTREKTQQRLAEEIVSIFAPAPDADAEAFQEALSSALGELPEEQRAVVHLKLWEGLTFDEIARALGIRPNTAASRYRYGIDKLRERLRPIYEEIK